MANASLQHHPTGKWQRWSTRAFLGVWTLGVVVLGLRYLVQAFAAGNVFAVVVGLVTMGIFAFVGLRAWRSAGLDIPTFPWFGSGSARELGGVTHSGFPLDEPQAGAESGLASTPTRGGCAPVRAGWRRLKIEHGGRSWIISEGGVTLASLSSSEISVGREDLGPRSTTKVRRRFHRRALVAGDGTVLAEAVRSSRPLAAHRTYDVTWPGSPSVQLVLESGREGDVRRHVAVLRSASQDLDLTEIEYVHTIGDWDKELWFGLRAREHVGRLHGFVDVSTTVPLTVVALCALLDLGSWARKAPREGVWTEESEASGEP